MQAHSIDAAIHFAGLKAVGESVAEPLAYFDNNVNGNVTLLRAFADAGVWRFLFSSSATVFGASQSVPLSESTVLSPPNPYDRSKLMVEHLLHDLRQSDPSWAVGVLRYFNPVGAHPSGLVGEDPRGTPNNLMPYVAQVAVGRHSRLMVFGNDYPTTNETRVRDYIHVVDLAQGHVAALARLLQAGDSFTLNLSTGRGYSVLEVMHAFEAASGVALPYDITQRHPGDIAICYSDPSGAEALFGWKARKGLEDMCADH